MATAIPGGSFDDKFRSAVSSVRADMGATRRAVGDAGTADAAGAAGTARDAARVSVAEKWAPQRQRLTTRHALY